MKALSGLAISAVALLTVILNTGSMSLAQDGARQITTSATLSGVKVMSSATGNGAGGGIKTIPAPVCSPCADFCVAGAVTPAAVKTY